MKIAIIAKNGEEREEKLKNYLSEELKAYGLEIIDNASVYEMIEKADKVILVFDAEVGMNPTFAEIGRILYKKRIYPILVITNSQMKEVDISYAKASLSDIWSMENPSLPPEELEFITFYFSYEKMMLDTAPKVTEDKLQILANIISKDA